MSNSIRFLFIKRFFGHLDEIANNDGVQVESTTTKSNLTDKNYGPFVPYIAQLSYLHALTTATTTSNHFQNRNKKKTFKNHFFRIAITEEYSLMKFHCTFKYVKIKVPKTLFPLFH